MPRLTRREQIAIQAMRPPPRPTYAELEREVEALRDDNRVLLAQLKQAQRQA